MAGVRAGGGRCEPGHPPGEEQPGRLAGLGPGDRRRDQGDALGQELRPGPVRPGLARDPAGGVGLQAVHARRRRSSRASRRARSTRRSRRCATSRVEQRQRLREQRRGRGRQRVPGPVERDAGLGERRLRAARARRRARAHRRRGPPDGDHRPPGRGPLDHARRRGGPDDGHGGRVRDARERRQALQRVGRPAGGVRRRPEGRPEGRTRPVPARARVRAGDQARDRAPGHRDAAAGRVLRDRHGGEHRPARGREDRHRAGLHERVLRRLHAAGLDRGLGGVPERSDPDGHVLRRVGVRWHGGRADLARLHGQGDGGLPGRGLRGAAAARERTGARRRGPPDRAGGDEAGEGELHADPRGGPLVRAGRDGPVRRPRAAAPGSGSGAR